MQINYTYMCIHIDDLSAKCINFKQFTGIIENLLLKPFKQARRCWLTPVILATQETRDQEAHSLKPAWANSSGDPILKTSNTEQGWWGGSRGRELEFKPQYCQVKKKFNWKSIH
jgi:hypothetical protein